MSTCYLLPSAPYPLRPSCHLAVKRYSRAGCAYQALALRGVSLSRVRPALRIGSGSGRITGMNPAHLFPPPPLPTGTERGVQDLDLADHRVQYTRQRMNSDARMPGCPTNKPHRGRGVATPASGRIIGGPTCHKRRSVFIRVRPGTLLVPGENRRNTCAVRYLRESPLS